MKKRILVWDLPVRLFHWILAASFIGAFLIANLVDDDSSWFALHMLLGATMGFMVLLRVVWGVVGTRWARFRSFLFGPTSILQYVRDAFAGEDEPHTGHNPGSSIAIFAIFVLTAGMVATGLLMSTGGELIEELHEIFAWAFLATVGVHIAGVLFHTLRHRENIVGSMITGRKEREESEAISSPRPVVALAFLVLTGGWAWGLYTGYDPATGAVTLPGSGQAIQVGEGEEHEEGGEHEESEEDFD